MSFSNIIKSDKKEVKLASLAGFCYGVSRAVDLCLKTREQNPDKTVCVLGQLIHNNKVIDFLENNGIRTINSVEEIPAGSVCIIRSHGEGPAILEQLKAKGVEIVDATCPDVKRVQSTAACLAEEGYQVIIIGQSDHPEVIAIEEHINSCNKSKALIISGTADVDNYQNIISESKKIGVVVQTTQSMEKFKSLLSGIASVAYEIRAYNTICNATFRRQQQAIEMARAVDLMVIVGSRKSANTTNLAQVCKNINNNTVFVEDYYELKNYNLDEFSNIGVTAGASTPKTVIDDVVDYLTKSINKGENVS